MNIFIKPLVFGIFSLVLALFGCIGPSAAFAATTPPLGAASTYGILGSTYTNTSAGTVVNGDVGFTTGPAIAPLGTHANYGSGAPYPSAGTSQANAASALGAQPCTFVFALGAINLSTDTTHGPVSVYTPGVYCSAGAMSIGGPLTLSGSGTYIFRPDGALTSAAGAAVNLNGASACDVFWTPTQAATLGANTTFAGSVISNAGITIGANTTWVGRSLAFGGTVTTDIITITVPPCSPVVPVVTTTSSTTVTVVSTSTAPSIVTSTPPALPIIISTIPTVTTTISAPAVIVPLVSLPSTGLSIGDDVLWYVFNLIIPSLFCATITSLYLFRKKA